MVAPTELPAWHALAAHRRAMGQVRLIDLFAADPERFCRFSIEDGDFLIDLSKNLITTETVEHLVDLARAAGVESARERLFSGARVNLTEQRAALHTALRQRGDEPVRVDGGDVMPEIRRVLAQMRHFVEAVWSGDRRGATGQRFRHVINLGIGGSDLGPAMACQALAPYAGPLDCRFVANVDGADLGAALVGLDPAATLFLVCSKTFTTDETLVNARTARAWVAAAVGEAAAARHFAGVSVDTAKVAEFGIEPAANFAIWPWVGGRYSLWSAVGLSIALSIGFERFEQLLAGAASMDQHFRTAPLSRNMPVLLGLIGLWYRNFWDGGSLAILPYDHRLRRLPAYLQQADMESNGKDVRMGGEPVRWHTGPVLFGEPGTNGQHAFYQLLHHGTPLVPADFIVGVESQDQTGGLWAEHHPRLLANCLAQSRALMIGRSADEVRVRLAAAGMPPAEIEAIVPHRTFKGNRPSNTIIYRRLDPFTLGRLIALYEHKIFVQGIIWDINSFDQWGVELGKELARDLLGPVRDGHRPAAYDGSTDGLLGFIDRLKGRGR